MAGSFSLMMSGLRWVLVHARRAWIGTCLCVGWVLGTALQLQQARLNAPWLYAAVAGLACLGLWGIWRGGLRSTDHAPELPLPPLGEGRDGGERRLVEHAVCVDASVAALTPALPQRGREQDRRLAIRLLCVLAAAALAWGCTGLRAGERLAQMLPHALDASDWRVTAEVVELPVRTASGMRFVLDVTQAQPASATSAKSTSADAPSRLPRLPMRIQLNISDEPWPDAPEAVMEQVRRLQGMRVGEQWHLPLRLRVPRGLMNPHAFDQELWYWSRGIAATASVQWRAEPPERLTGATGWRLEAWREDVRTRIAQTLHTQAQGDARAMQLVTALTMGDQSSIAEGDWQVFRDTGVAHLVSISGLHITGLAALAMWGAGWLWRGLGRLGGPGTWLVAHVTRQGWARGCGLMVALVYSAFSGWGVPAQRTVLMLAAWVLLRQIGVRWPWLASGLAVMALVVAVDPWALLQAGFWLSFVAVAVLLFITDSEKEYSPLPLNKSTENANTAHGYVARAARAMARAAWALLRLQGLLLVALAPLTMLWFGQISLVGLLANLVAIPWVTWLITPLCLLGLLWAPAWQWAATASEPLLVLLREMAAWPQASVLVAAAPWPLAGLAFAGAALFVLVRGLPWRAGLRWRAVALLLLLPALLWRSPRPDVGQFELLAFDVGQGSAILVRTARHGLLYDAGPRYGASSDAGERVIVPALRAMGETLDRVVLSHADMDHVGGATPVLLAQPRADLWGSLSPDDPWPALRPGWRACAAGQQWEWDGVRFEVLFPSAHWRPGQGARNEGSCVLRVSGAAGQAALLTGDIGHSQEGALLLDHADEPGDAGGATHSRLRATVLLAGHHGSAGSSGAAFLQAVRPDWVWVQAGHGNRFGHPAPAMLARASAAGAQVRATPACGAIRWQSGRPGVVSCQRELARRYWHAGGSASE